MILPVTLHENTWSGNLSTFCVDLDFMSIDDDDDNRKQTEWSGMTFIGLNFQLFRHRFLLVVVVSSLNIQKWSRLQLSSHEGD